MPLHRFEEPWQRAIRFIKPWMDARPELYRPQLGYSGLGAMPIDLEDLTEDALLRLAECIRRDFWSKRRRDRENRAISAARSTRLLALSDAGRDVEVLKDQTYA